MSDSAAPDRDTLKSKARHVVEATARGDFEGASRDFGPVMRSALPPEKLAETWRTLEQQVGPFVGLGDFEVREEQGVFVCLAGARFQHADIVARVVFDSAAEVIGLFFTAKPAAVDWTPPDYVKSDSFEERAVLVGTSPALPGVLSVPHGEGPFPAVVLVHGSGPNDQDETVGGTKVFKDLAWGLSSRGVVVLRYVKRSRHSPAGIVTQKAEVLDAAHDAIALLRATPRVDPGRVFVLGHSQGGNLAPRIARDDAQLAGIVSLAGSTRSLQDAMLEQLVYLSTLGPESPALAAMIEATRKFKAIVESPDLTPDQKVDLPTGGSVTGAYFLDVRDYDAPAVAAELACRILVLQGERDYQVTMTDFEAWRAALAKRPNAVLKTYPCLNHLFVHGEGPPSPAEYEHPGHVDRSVVEDIAAWIDAGASPQTRLGLAS